MPLTPELAAYKDKRDQEIAAIIRSESDKLLLVIGPCSADREDAVIDYIHRLAEVQKQVADKILIVPRIYTGKPRTTGCRIQGYAPPAGPGQKAGYVRGYSRHSPYSPACLAGDRAVLCRRDAVPGESPVFKRPAGLCGRRCPQRREPGAPADLQWTGYSCGYEESHERGSVCDDQCH